MYEILDQGDLMTYSSNICNELASHSFQLPLDLVPVASGEVSLRPAKL